MQERGPLWQRLVDNIWFWLAVSNILFFLVYLLWGWVNVWSIPAR